MLLRLFILGLLYVSGLGQEDHIASKFRAEQAEKQRCGYNIRPLWHTEVGHSPFAAAPLITDVDGDGGLDIVVAPFSEVLTVLEGDTGTALRNSRWPTQNLKNSIHASPLQYDIDGDGMLDMLFALSSGELKFYKFDGTLLVDFFYQLPPVYVMKDWYKKVLFVSLNDIHEHIADAVTHSVEDVPVDPHILATPVIADLNNDDRIEELVIPVTYYFDEADYRSPERQQHLTELHNPVLNNYLVAGVTIFNLTSLQPIQQIYLDLTQFHSQYPAFALFTPTVIDLDSNSSDLEIVLGTSAGNIYVLSSSGHQRKEFPKSMGPVHGQITVADVNADGFLELIAIDTSGNVACLDRNGATVWEGKVTGSTTAGSRVTDINQDGILDVVIATNEGDIFALNGTTGQTLPKWPLKIGSRVAGNILLTKIGLSGNQPDLVFIADDGNIYIVSGDQACRVHIPVGETSLVEILSHDLVPLSRGLELLVSTNDGTVICLGSSYEPLPEEWVGEKMSRDHQLQSWPAVTKTPNDFTYSPQTQDVYVISKTRDLGEVTGGYFWLYFEIIDGSKLTFSRIVKSYTLKVYYGKHLLAKSVYSSPGVYSIKVPTWPEPGQGHVTVMLTNQHGQIFQDMFSLKCNKLILQDLQWLVLAPFVAMVTILLINHGFPAKDLLPMTFPSKSK